ncbi:tyrosine-type recombinase/integrase [Bacteroides ovatus]|nr:tyrosine-type recombinase/integrase [Bacteroides ovatus]
MAYLSVDGVKLLLAQVPADTVASRRDLAMLALLYDTGARVQELISLRPCDLHLEAPAYLIFTRQGKQEPCRSPSRKASSDFAALHKRKQA